MARPNIWRLSIFSRLTCPSDRPGTPTEGEAGDDCIVITAEAGDEGMQRREIISRNPNSWRLRRPCLTVRPVSCSAKMRRTQPSVWQTNLLTPEADHYRPTRHRGIGEPTLVPAVNS